MPRFLLICLGLLTVNLLSAQVAVQRVPSQESTEVRSFKAPRSAKKGARNIRMRPKNSFQRRIESRKVDLTKKQQPQWESKGFWAAPKNKRQAQFRYLAKKRNEWP